MTISSKEIYTAAQHIKSGGIVIYPTDTAYAIGCAFDNMPAIRAIMKLKGRKDVKFTIIASSLQQVQKYFSLNA